MFLQNERADAFFSGNEKRAYELFGVHKDDSSYVFRVFAPNADRVFLVGDFNGWQETCPMKMVADGGIWQSELPLEPSIEGNLYKYKLYRGDSAVYRSDPYACSMEAPPNSASIVREVGGYVWRDKGWMEQRKEYYDGDMYSLPMNIYELHAGSWKKHADGTLLGYEELARELAPYVKQMGYTHVELLPVMEHPYGGSWGYQVGGYCAPTSRYGSAHGLMSFVDIMHGAGIGVILDWVPAHFPKDEFGLANFDGLPVYEYEDPARANIDAWGTLRFNIASGGVRSFLVSNAIYWLEIFHADGLRVDAVSSIIYPDGEGRWGERGLECAEGVEFLTQLNRTVKNEHPDVMMIAEDLGTYVGITSPDEIGFDLKWNLGWMNDTLTYASTDFKERPDKHGRLTFPLMYAFDERFILPISHDEVVHGKKSFLDKMPGDYWRKFAGARAFEALKMTMPGKKLTFMGCEIGQFREWDCDGSVEWFLLDYESHARHQLFCAELNHFYLAHSELWQKDHDWQGFKWLEPDDSERCILSYTRTDDAGRSLTVAVNLTPAAYDDFFLPVPEEGIYEELFNTDDEKFGGSGVTNRNCSFPSLPNPILTGGKAAEKRVPYAIRLRLPPLGAVIVKKASPKKR